jgi:hypothetical protein
MRTHSNVSIGTKTEGLTDTPEKPLQVAGSQRQATDVDPK